MAERRPARAEIKGESCNAAGLSSPADKLDIDLQVADEGPFCP